ncbi:Uncharacterised protein [Odoribacter splanchnicus]|nr:Uncharacterised protein [Odoribacter splanchnicus]
MNTDVNLLSFNSTLVQLKVLVFVLEVLRLICFNSTLVQLKDAGIIFETRE